MKISQLLTGINQETEKFGEKMKLSSLKNRRGIGSFSALILVGVIAVGQGGLFAASADESSSVTSSVCTSVNDYSITLTGNFPTPVTDVAVNFVNIPRTSWTQTATDVVVKVAASNPSTPNNLIVYYGTSLEYLSVDVSCAAITTSTPDPTEDGGTLPNTGSNNYNYLVAGIGLALVGTRGLLRRKPIQE